MKTNRFATAIIVAFGLPVFLTAAYAENQKIASAILPPTMAVVTIAVIDSKPGSASILQATATSSPEATSAVWADIKDCTYDLRAQFFAGLDRMEARVDREIARLTDTRAAMKSTANTADWDFAMKEMVDARSNLKSMDEELHKATPETWAQEKDKVGRAWVRTQEAYDKVKSSMTS
jgi:hypothetical protein